MMNPLLLIDGYKLDHRRQYPKGTTRVYSNWTPRGSRVPGQNEVVFFGLQYFLYWYMGEKMRAGFFARPKSDVVREYEEFTAGYLGPNDIGTNHIAALHDLGYMPLAFRALPEGTLCPLRVPMLTVENTHDDFYWLVNYIETIMSAVLWMPCTSATNAYRLRRILNDGAERTGDPSFVQWQGHDFSMRGMPGLEAAQLSGAGHLLSFTGSDTVPAIGWVNKFYPGENGLIAGSVPATEHSVMSAGGQMNEADTFDRLLSLYPRGIVSVVSDTWNLWDVLTKTLPALRDKILSRDGKLVIRPDSGDPTKIICGDPDATPGTPEHRGVVRLLWDVFGGTVNDKGFMVLDPHIGVIYGDAITYERCESILRGLRANGFATTNMVFGVGSFTYQYVTRDTYGFAMKATWAKVDGDGIDLFKKPVTDSGEKFSATGRLAVVEQGDSMRVICRATGADESASLLRPVWSNGEFLRRQSFAAVRQKLWGVA